MSKEKPFENKIPAFYKKNAVDLMMFGFVRGVKHTLPSMDRDSATNRCVESFLKEFGLTEDDYPIESAMRTHTRITEDFLWKDK